jgi:Fe-S-cluster containining protein
MKNTFYTTINSIYQAMDSAWNEAACKYGFKCNGCEDNCCKSLFFHHTHLEKDYFIEGYLSLSEELKAIISSRSDEYVTATFSQDTGTGKKLFCPVNQDGRCLVYDHRPMICRLHGLPHEIHKPGNLVVKGPGCEAGGFENRSYHTFDRTPFYQQLAQAEFEYRTENKRFDRINETIAQMILSTR